MQMIVDLLMKLCMVGELEGKLRVEIVARIERKHQGASPVRGQHAHPVGINSGYQLISCCPWATASVDELADSAPKIQPPGISLKRWVIGPDGGNDVPYRPVRAVGNQYGVDRQCFPWSQDAGLGAVHDAGGQIYQVRLLPLKLRRRTGNVVLLPPKLLTLQAELPDGSGSHDQAADHGYPSRHISPGNHVR